MLRVLIGALVAVLLLIGALSLVGNGAGPPADRPPSAESLGDAEEAGEDDIPEAPEAPRLAVPEPPPDPQGAMSEADLRPPPASKLPPEIALPPVDGPAGWSP